MTFSITKRNFVFFSSSSGAHSQASSLADDCVDSYVPVQSGVRPTAGEEYIDMEASHRQHANANTNSSISSAASSCSITSGTPSTDMRFAEYQLDKIVSHFTPDDDDPSFIADRPIRAYSVGSRLEHNKRKLRVDMLTAEHCNNSPSSRVRAFSVGSKAKVARSDLYRGSNNSSTLTKTMSSDLVNLISTINNNNNNNLIKNLKASAANNILNNNNAASKTSLTAIGSGAGNTGTGNKKGQTASALASMNSKTNSIDPMDDLMEIDFTKKDDDSLSNDSSYDQNHASCDDLMEIDYPQFSSYGSSTSSTGGGGGGGSGLNRRKTASMPVGTNSNTMSARVSQPVPITTKRNDVMMPPRQGYSFEQIEQQKNKDGYMNMKPVGNSESRHGSTSSLAFNKNTSSLSSSPTKSISRPPTVSSPAATHRAMLQSRTPRTSINSDDYLNMSPISTRSNQPQVTPASSVATPTPIVGSGSAPEGYMEMSWGKLSMANARNNNNNNNISSTSNNNNNVANSNASAQDRNTQSSSSSISSSNEYINMNFSGNIPRTSSASSDGSSGSGQNVPTTSQPNRTAAPSNASDSRTNRMRSMPITIRSNKSQTTTATQAQQCGATLPTQLPVNQPPNHHPQSFAAGKMFPPSYLNINAKVSSALTQSNSLDDDAVTPTAMNATSDVASSQHSAAIFPFSPNSPNSGTNKQIFSSQQQPQTSQTQQQLPCEEQKRKCLVDGTTGECSVHFHRRHEYLITNQSISLSLSLVRLAGTLRLSESESDASNSNPIPSTSSSAKSQSATTPLDVLSSDYADMTLGNSIRNTGPMLSPKENIKKLKSSFFGCSTIDENATDYVNCKDGQPKAPSTSATGTVGVRKDSVKTSKTDDNAGDYAIMNPSSTRRIVTQNPPLNSTSNIPSVFPMATKKSVLVTSNNNPDKVLANTQSKTNNDGFKPITPHADNEVLKQNPKSILPLTAFNRQHSAPADKPRKTSTDNAGYELLELRGSSSAHTVGTNSRIARPNSVNSEKTTFTPLMRPNSANSERQTHSTYSLASATFSGTALNSNANECSSLMSSSSTLCGSGTITRPHSSTFLSSGSEYSQTSRPSSVISVIDPQQVSGSIATATATVILSRPPSVSSERELHYASLDLPPCSSSNAVTMVNNVGNLPTGAASIQNPIAGAEAPSFTYAQIDFVKSTEHSNNPSNSKQQPQP